MPTLDSTLDSTTLPTAEVPGWYGKLPTLGDFASRRLAADFIEPWDDWLARGIGAWREAEPEAWLDAYLSGPSWRFILMPGVLPGPSGRFAWCGVLMPSVDRVGRYFPMTIAQPLTTLPAEGAATDALLRWLQRLDDLAVDALQDDWDIEQLETALHAAGGWPPAQPVPHEAAGQPTLALHEQTHGHSLWLGFNADGRTDLLVQTGLPSDEAFRALLSGAACTPSLPHPHDFP